MRSVAAVLFASAPETAEAAALAAEGEEEEAEHIEGGEERGKEHLAVDQIIALS